jgi:hypothetical protein
MHALMQTRIHIDEKTHAHTKKTRNQRDASAHVRGHEMHEKETKKKQVCLSS